MNVPGAAEVPAAEEQTGENTEKAVMIEQVRETVRSIVEGEGSVWAGRGFFVVDTVCWEAAGRVDEVEVTVDCDGITEQGRPVGVGIDDCTALSREISDRLGGVLSPQAEQEADFALTVMSAGLGQPLRMGRQYRKIMQQAAVQDRLPQVDILFRDGRKLEGVVLCGIGYSGGTEEDIPAEIEVMYEVRELLPGKKRKEWVERRERIRTADAKAVSEHFEFK